jgi:Flp pilus assembly protein TadB
MTPHMKVGIAGVIVGLLLIIFGVPWYVPLLIIALAIAIPAAAYAMLDPSQRRRLRRIRQQRKQLDR